MLFAVVDEVSLRAELVGKLTGPESFFEASLLSDWLWIVEHSVVFLTVRRSFWKLLMINDWQAFMPSYRAIRLLYETAATCRQFSNLILSVGER